MVVEGRREVERVEREVGERRESWVVRLPREVSRSRGGREGRVGEVRRRT